MSTFFQIIGGIVGAVIGWYVGGGPAGAAYGFAIGAGLASVIDPTVPDVPQPGEPMGELEIMTNTEGSTIPDVLGTTKLTGNLFYYGNNYRTAITEEVDSGGLSFGGGSETVVTGYRYFLSWAMGFCLGPVDTIFTVYFDDEIVWAGSLPRSIATKGMVTLLLAKGDRQDIVDAFTGEGYQDIYESIYGTIPDYYNDEGIFGTIMQNEGFWFQKLLNSGNYVGLMHFYFGTEDQEPNDWLTELMIEEGAIEDETLAVPYRRQCYAYFDDCFIGEYNRCPTPKIVVRKAPECSFDT